VRCPDSAGHVLPSFEFLSFLKAFSIRVGHTWAFWNIDILVKPLVWLNTQMFDLEWGI
jgi:hypothetical protein